VLAVVHLHRETEVASASGHSWARTSDLRLVEAALSQLSYAPGAEKFSG
jgi:hypothetical protein